MNLLIICGRAYTGKSTVARHIVGTRKNWTEVRLSSHIKDICSERYGIDRKRLDGDNEQDRLWREKEVLHEGMTARDLLISIGTELRSNDKTILPKMALQKIRNELKDRHVVVSDCRFNEDIEYLRSNTERKVTVIKLVRKDLPILIEQEDVIDDIPSDLTVHSETPHDHIDQIDSLWRDLMG